MMKTIRAKIIDPMHLELSQPIAMEPGQQIDILIPNETEEDSVWRDAAKKRFLDVYDEQDAIYDAL